MGERKTDSNTITVIWGTGRERALPEKIYMRHRLQDLEYLVTDCVLGKSKDLRSDHQVFGLER